MKLLAAGCGGIQHEDSGPFLGAEEKSGAEAAGGTP